MSGAKSRPSCRPMHQGLANGIAQPATDELPLLAGGGQAARTVAGEERGFLGVAGGGCVCWRLWVLTIAVAHRVRDADVGVKLR